MPYPIKSTAEAYPAEKLVHRFAISKKNYSGNAALFPVITEKKEHYTLLIIENNSKVAAFISDSLSNCKVTYATDGPEGLQKAFDQVPDVIMINPFMHGINCRECCIKLKENKRTSHIPLIVLMGKIKSDACTEDLDVEADDYLIEPFSPGELWFRLKKVLSRQRRQQRIVHKEWNNPVTPEHKTVSPASQVSNDPFLKNVYGIIEKNLDDATFGVEELANRICMSKANLHRKVKALTGLAPGGIIKNHRLFWAAHYLKAGCNSSETACKAGFNSPAYFTKCFRDFYKLTPLEFSRQK